MENCEVSWCMAVRRNFVVEVEKEGVLTFNVTMVRKITIDRKGRTETYKYHKIPQAFVTFTNFAIF